MHRAGHHGVALLTYAPLVAVVSLAAPELYLLAALGATCLVNPLWPIKYAIGRNVSFSLSMLPDIDMKLPGVKHRGPTHTVWFALLVAALFAGVGAVLGPALVLLVSLPVDPTLLGAAFLGYIGFHAVITHMLADMLTPMGVRPFAPVSGREYGLGLVNAGNVVANPLLFALGVVAVVAAFFAELLVAL